MTVQHYLELLGAVFGVCAIAIVAGALLIPDKYLFPERRDRKPPRDDDDPESWREAAAFLRSKTESDSSHS